MRSGNPDSSNIHDEHLREMFLRAIESRLYVRHCPPQANGLGLGISLLTGQTPRHRTNGQVVQQSTKPTVPLSVSPAHRLLVKKCCLHSERHSIRALLMGVWGWIQRLPPSSRPHWLGGPLLRRDGSWVFMDSTSAEFDATSEPLGSECSRAPLALRHRCLCCRGWSYSRA